MNMFDRALSFFSPSSRKQLTLSFSLILASMWAFMDLVSGVPTKDCEEILRNKIAAEKNPIRDIIALGHGPFAFMIFGSKSEGEIIQELIDSGICTDYLKRKQEMRIEANSELFASVVVYGTPLLISFLVLKGIADCINDCCTEQPIDENRHQPHFF